MAEPLIRTENLEFSYPQEGADHLNVPVLRGVNLTIEKGEYVAILGHNGSGKSTFAKLLNLILEPSAGKIYIDGQDITSPDMTDEDVYNLRRRVGMVFQNPDNQLVATLVEEDVAFGPENLGLDPMEIRRRVDEALDMVGMREYAHHEPHRLSGGQKQRVAIAGLIAMMPECMILDEATAMLDPMGRREVIDTVETLHRERGITVLTITHHMNEAARADRIIVLDDGEVLLDGTPEEVFSHPDVLRAAGLDVPQSAALVHGLRELGILADGKVGSIVDCVQTICRAYEYSKSLQ
ncbi:MAG: energy-coupling factor transporter ATPase [Clostridia bacterium]|nr:energy-coupling factor transporter ATPase [Clostridia bacterium]